MIGKEHSIGKVRLFNYKNTEYTGKIKVGDQRQELDVIFDTGSANVWLNSVLCDAPGCLNHKQYDSSLSKSFYSLGSDLEVQFGTGKLQGLVNGDNISIGDIMIKDQQFAEIQNEVGNVFIDVSQLVVFRKFICIV